MTLTSSLLAIPAIDVDRFRHGAQNARYLDRRTIDDYERLNTRLWEAFSKARAKREVLPLAKQQLAILNRALNEPHGSDIRLRLSALTGDLFQLCGEIFFDSDSYADAAHCYSLAAYASKEARNADMWACAMTRHAFISIYERRYDDAAPLLAGGRPSSPHAVTETCPPGSGWPLYRLRPSQDWETCSPPSVHSTRPST